MKIEQKKVTVGDIYENYFNDEEEGVRGYHNLLNIRPKYQREFIYKDKERDEVIRTIFKGLPLNVMYWCKTDNGDYELLDGQQRTMSFCEYVDGAFSVDDKYFDNLPGDVRKKFLDYPLFIYVAEGTESEKLDWFKIINIAGEALTDQELRNAIYSGSWVADAKRYFSKTGCAAYGIASDYLKGSSIRQEYLETAIKWICDRENMSIEEYMAQHQHDKNAVQLWNYFRSVIDWVQATFPNYRKEMKGVAWGILYNQNKDRTDLDSNELEQKIKELMADDDVTKKSGIYEYVLDGNERCLNIRAFDNRDKRTAYERQDGQCAICGKETPFSKMQADHIVPWSKGGATVLENCQMLCRDCNLKKSNK